jgi:hypothetical protein
MDTTPCTVLRRREERSATAHHGWELYMVDHELWASAVGDRSDDHGLYLCVGCLERRLRRS